MQEKNVSGKVLTASLVVSMFLWGLSWPSGKVLTHYSSPVNFTVYRYFIVVLTLLPTLLLLKVQVKISRAGIPAAVASGLLLALYSYLFFCGLRAGSAGAGGVLVTTLNPIMAYIIGIFLNRRLPSRNEGIGLLLGIIAGCLLLKVWYQPGRVFESGNLYFLLAALTWAVMSKITSRGANYGSSLGFSLWQYMVTLVCLLPFIDVHELAHAITVTDAKFWGNMLFSSAIVTSLATTVYFYSTTRLGAEKASSFIFLVPLAAAISSWFLLGEQIMLFTAMGGVMGMAAVYMINKKRKPLADSN